MIKEIRFCLNADEAPSKLVALPVRGYPDIYVNPTRVDPRCPLRGTEGSKEKAAAWGKQ